ncbi:MAG: hypothetical protein AB1801_00060 [Chloroflexota bacterium]
MNASVLSRIEDTFSQLSLTEQLWLIERLIQHIRENMLQKESLFETQLAVMSADPEIQTELQQIEAEFVLAEVDGLETP